MALFLKSDVFTSFKRECEKVIKEFYFADPDIIAPIDQMISTARKSGVPFPEKDLKKAAHIAVFNSAGEMLMQHRYNLSDRCLSMTGEQNMNALRALAARIVDSGYVTKDIVDDNLSHITKTALFME